MSSSIFSKIAAGEIPCYKIAEDENYLAFLDVFPLKKGHTLVIPKKEVDQLFDLDQKTYSGLMEFVYKISPAIKAAIPCNRISVHVIGLEVPHVHIHLIPINTMDDCNFSNAKLKLSKEEFEEVAAKIRGFFNKG
jgi:histidine triad (HIT) family protein